MAALLYEQPQTRRNFFLPDFLYEALQQRARETGEPMSAHVREALMQYLNKEEPK